MRTRVGRQLGLAGVVGVIGVIGLGGCGDGAPAPTAATGATDPEYPPAATSYDGPLTPPGTGRYGLAGDVVACSRVGAGFDRGPGVFGQGATSGSVAGAVETAYSEGLFLDAPQVELAVAGSDDDRQLLTYESDGRVLMALVLRDGPATEGAGGPGWYLESWARCDWAELPAAVAEGMGVLAWTDAAGVPVPTSRVYSYPGPEHCDWQSMTFLALDDGRRTQAVYVRAPDAELEPYLAAPWRARTTLPPDARDTGWERDGDHLWLAADGTVAYVGDRSRVEAWPRSEAGCE